MAEQFLTKTGIQRADCLEVGGRLALESYPALKATLAIRVLSLIHISEPTRPY